MVIKKRYLKFGQIFKYKKNLQR